MEKGQEKKSELLGIGIVGGIMQKDDCWKQIKV